MTTPATTLLVGHGLLGRRIRLALERDAATVRIAAVPWSDPAAARAALQSAAHHAGEGWRLVWCAGAGVIGTDPGALRSEVELARDFVAGLDVPPTALLLASSAGGVYAGAHGPPYTERHQPRPLSPYGEAKLGVEAAMTTLAARGTRVAIARMSNVYGPGQDLTKPQGLVSQLCRSSILDEPLTIYVPVDTLRDYLYVDDAAVVAAAMLQRVEAEPPGTVVVKIVASGQSTTVTGLVSAAMRAFRRRPPVTYAVRVAPGQVHDLRMRSQVWSDLDALGRTPLVVGLRATAEDVAAQHRSGQLTPR